MQRNMLLIVPVLMFGLVSGADVGSCGYGVIVDAGSSGSRVYVYKWNPDDWTRSRLPEITLNYTYKVRPGLSSYAENFTAARQHVRELLTKAKENVPVDSQADTPLLFMATAGLRLLGESMSLQMMTEVETLLDDATVNPFWHDVDVVRILSGEGEGAFSWLAVNYLKGDLNQASPDTVGVLEMGGASSQITFLPEVDPLADKFPVRVLGQNFGIYTHSYLGVSQDAVVDWVERSIAELNPGKLLLESPCMLKGDYKEVKTEDNNSVLYYGTGDPQFCDILIAKFFSQMKAFSCSPQPCGLGTYQPSIPADMKLYLLASYYYVALDIGLIPRRVNEAVIRPEQYREKAYEYCARDYADVATVVGDSPFISLSCSSALLIHKLLTMGFGIQENSTNLHVTSRIDGAKISWSLGALIYEVEKLKRSNGVSKPKVIKALQEIIERLRNEK